MCSAFAYLTFIEFYIAESVPKICTETSAMKVLFALFLVYSNIAMAEPGFWPIQHEKVPEKVRLAAKSVYQVYLPSAQAEWLAIHEVPSQKPYLRQRFPEDDRQLLIFQELSLCEQQMWDKCRYSVSKMPAATLYAIENNQFVSVTHSLIYYVQRLIYLQGIKKPEILGLKIPAVISDGKKLFPVFLKVSKAKIETVEVLQKQLRRHPTAGFEEDFDGIVFEVEGFKAKEVLKIAKDTPKPGDKIYALGFPAATNNRKQFFNVPDSNGKSLYVTMGEAIDGKEMIKRRIKGIDVEVTDEELRRYVAFGGDGAVGLSGGAMVNQEGEVVGVVHSIHPHYNKLTTKEEILKMMIMGMNIHFLLE